MAPTRPPPTEAQLNQSNEWKEKGNTAFRSKNFTEALRCYTEGIALNPESQILYSNRSAAFLSLKRFPLALNDAKRAVELAPGWAKAYRRKASVLDAMRRYQEAKLVYEKALEVVKTDDSLSDSAREKDAAEVKGMIENLYHKINDKPKDHYGQIRSIMDVRNTPGVLILQEAERRIQTGEPVGAWPPIGSCFRRLWLAEMQFHNALVHLFEFEARPAPLGYPQDMPMISGRLQTLEELTTALIEDNRVGRFDRTAFEKLQLCYTMEQYCRNAVGPNISARETISEYARRLVSGPPDARPGPSHPAGAPENQQKPSGWDYVRPALQLSIRSSLMNGLLETANYSPLFDHGIAELQRARDLIVEARRQWPDVDGSLRGRTLETTFLRQVKGYLGDALVMKYNLLSRNNGPAEERRALLTQILELGTWMVDSIKAEPQPKKQPQHLQQPAGMSLWWGVYYSHYAAPLAKAYSLIGIAHHRLAKDFEYTDFTSPSTGKRGPRACEPRRLGLAAYNFVRAAAWTPADDPNRCTALWNAIMCMVERGGYFLADFECVRDMAVKCPPHFTDFFPEDIIPEDTVGKIVASEVVGTAVGSPPDQICSPLVSWPEGVHMDTAVMEEVLEPWTKKLVGGKGGGMLAVTNVIRDVWRQREEDGESVDAIGSELIWGEIEPGLREDWDMVWAEHVEDCMPTFTEDKVQVGEGDEDSDDSDDSVELTRSVVGV